MNKQNQRSQDGATLKLQFITDLVGAAVLHWSLSGFTCNFFFQAEDGIRVADVTGVQTCALPIWRIGHFHHDHSEGCHDRSPGPPRRRRRSEEHTSELQSRPHLVCRLRLEKKKEKTNNPKRASSINFYTLNSRSIY